LSRPGLAGGIAGKLDEPFTAVMGAKLASEPVHLDAAGFAARWASDTTKLCKVVTKSGILELVQSQNQ
jgi:hypothetical protein